MVFALGFMWKKATDPTAADIAGTQTQDVTDLPEVTNKDHVRGSLDAEVYMVEYSDYYCPYCSIFHPTVKKIIEEYGDKVAWVYRHFPLDQAHPHARALAEISECVEDVAGSEAFWNFSDAVYENVPDNPDKALELVESLNLDKSAVESCFKDGKFKTEVQAQYNGGIKAGVNGTPGTFIVDKNGKTVSLPGAVSYEALKQAIDQALDN